MTSWESKMNWEEEASQIEATHPGSVSQLRVRPLQDEQSLAKCLSPIYCLPSLKS